MPDVELLPLVPEQYRSACRVLRTPEQRLMCAVLEDAFAVRRRGPRASGRCVRRRYAEVRRWFASRDVVWPFSFVNVCDALGLDPSAVAVAAQRLDGDEAERHAAAVAPLGARRERGSAPCRRQSRGAG